MLCHLPSWQQLPRSPFSPSCNGAAGSKQGGNGPIPDSSFSRRPGATPYAGGRAVTVRGISTDASARRHVCPPTTIRAVVPALFRLPPNICRPAENGTILSTTGPQHDQRPKKLLRAFPRCCNVLFLRLRRRTGEGFSVFAASGAGIRCLSSWRKNYSRLRAPAASVAACLSASCPRRRGRAGSSAAGLPPNPYRPEKTDTDRSRPSCPKVP